MFEAYHMIDLVGKPCVILVNEAVLAPIPRSAGYRGALPLTDITPHATEAGEP